MTLPLDADSSNIYFYPLNGSYQSTGIAPHHLLPPDWRWSGWGMTQFLMLVTRGVAPNSWPCTLSVSMSPIRYMRKRVAFFKMKKNKSGPMLQSDLNVLNNISFNHPLNCCCWSTFSQIFNTLSYILFTFWSMTLLQILTIIKLNKNVKPNI